jgi:hypothetical protein
LISNNIIIIFSSIKVCGKVEVDDFDGSDLVHDTQISPCKDRHVDSTEIIACREQKNYLEVYFSV